MLELSDFHTMLPSVRRCDVRSNAPCRAVASPIDRARPRSVVGRQKDRGAAQGPPATTMPLPDPARCIGATSGFTTTGTRRRMASSTVLPKFSEYEVSTKRRADEQKLLFGSDNGTRQDSNPVRNSQISGSFTS